jgi:hypothetical protein
MLRQVADDDILENISFTEYIFCNDSFYYLVIQAFESIYASMEPQSPQY